MQLDAVCVGREPGTARWVEPVARPVVDNEKDLAAAVAAHQQAQEVVESPAVKHWRELIGEPGVVQREGSVDVGSLAQPVRVYARLDSNSTPRLVERAIEPEACLVFEQDDAATPGRFFLIAGKRVRSQAACRSRSARASRFLGRCTEKPS